MSSFSNRVGAPTVSGYEFDRIGLLFATLAFTIVTTAAYIGEVVLPGGHRMVILILFPVALLWAATRSDRIFADDLRFCAAWSIVLLLAFEVVPAALQNPVVAAGAPFVLVVAALIARFPAAGIGAAALLSGTFGSFQAFLGLSPNLLIDLLIAGSIVLLLTRILAGRPQGFFTGFAVLSTLLYFVLTILAWRLASDPAVAYFGVRTTIWFMLIMLVVAYMGWPAATHLRLARALMIVTLIVAGYAVLRSIIGPSAAEEQLARISSNGINVDPVTDQLRTVGSFLTTHQMSFWMSMMGPFCAGFALRCRGRMRLFALAAVGLSILASLASHARGPLVGLALGLLLVLGLYQFARAFTGFKAGVAAIAIATVGVLGGVGLVLGNSNQAQLDRYANILHPSSDGAFAQREIKWEQIWPDVTSHPLGNGLGSAGQGEQIAGQFLNDTTTNLDNSYIKIAYEQGLPVMVLFAAAMLGVLFLLCRGGIATTSRDDSALAIGAAGALVGMLVSFYTGLYIEATPILVGWIAVGIGLAPFVRTGRSEQSAPAPA